MAKSLRQYREELYLTAPEFADHLGIALDTLYRIQKGERPRITTMRKIAEKLGVHPSEITDFVPREVLTWDETRPTAKPGEWILILHALKDKGASVTLCGRDLPEEPSLQSLDMKLISCSECKRKLSTIDEPD